MEFRDAVKALRKELGLTQMELANALNINYATIGRWEKGANLPSRSITTALLNFAKSQSASDECLELLSRAITKTAKEKIGFRNNDEFQNDDLTSQLKVILDNIDGGISAAIFDKDGSVRLAYANDSYYSILGYTKEQFASELNDPHDVLHPDDVQFVGDIMKNVKATGEPADFRYRVIKRDGSIVNIRCTTKFTSINGLSNKLLISVLTDITDMVKATEALGKQNDKINAALNSTPSGIAIIEVNPGDIKGTIHTTYYNDRFISFSGYNREEYEKLLRGNEFHFVFDEDLPFLIEATKKMCEGDIHNTVDCTIRCHTKLRDYRWLLITGQLSEKRDDICVINVSLIDITERKEAEDKQRISEEMLRIAAETDKRAIITYNVKANTCRIESHNLFLGKFGEILHNIPQSLINRGVVAPESTDEILSLYSRIHAGEKIVVVSLRMRTGEDEFQWFECNSHLIFDADENPDHAVLVLHNITEQRIKEAVYKKWQQSIHNKPLSSYTLFRCNLSRDAGLDEHEGELLKIKFGSESTSFNSRTKIYAEEYVYPDDREAYYELLDSDTLLAMFYRNEHTTTLEYREMNANGQLLWRKLTVEMVEYLNSTDVQVFLMYEDINELKERELREKELAETDPLTGALNRATFALKAEQFISEETGCQHALLMIDLDGFKLLNDTFGHAAGDQALQEITAIIRSLIREQDYVCRLGGDEFLIWLQDMPYDAVIAKIAQQACEHIRKSYSLDVQISASIGIAVFPRDGHDFDELYRTADKALYSVKQSGKDGYAFFSTTDDSQDPKSANQISNLKASPQSPLKPKRRLLIVDDSESIRLTLKAMFQDEYLVETAKNGAEAMIRMRHFGSSISVVLLDLVMPGMSGFDVLKKMQNNGELRTIPVIVVSSDSDHQSLLKSIELGAADYITKPVDIDLIRLRVQSAISKAENERLRAQNSYLQLQKDEEIKYRTVLESTGTVVIEYNWRNHVFIYDSEISKHLAGDYNHRGLWQVFLADMIAGSADVKIMQDMLISLANTRGKTQDDRLIMLKTPNLDRHWFRMNIYKREDEFGLAEKMIITFNDVHEEILANDRLLFQATHDELTGLYNRTGFIQKAAQLIALKSPGYYVISCIDIEKFKVINDQYGTEKGDIVLQRFASYLERLHHDNNGICCRIMADNFAVLYPQSLIGSKELSSTHHDIERMDRAIPFIKFCVGRYVIDDPTLDVSSAYDRASIAKDTVKGRYDMYIATYDESMRTSILRQQEITGQMNYALQNGQFHVWLQPQFNHATGMLSGAEALVRWHHPEEGVISPVEFIPIFERNGFVYEVDKFVWEQTCILIRGWLDSGYDPVPVSVNVSRYDVFRNDFYDTITGLIDKYDIPITLMRLEITESAFSESTDQIIRVVEELVKYGFVVEIDDFGSGYSSLNTLKDVPAQVLKMDMHFLENDSNSQRGGSIIESIIRMARWLGMSVIAEGVETIAQADFLKSIGCEYIQGFLYSRPTRIREYEQLFDDNKIESRLQQMNSIATWNNNAFWNPESMETLIFNSYVGGACIFEYHDGIAELLRHNDAFESIIGKSFGYKRTNAHNDILTVLDDANSKLFSQTITRAINSKKEASCEIEITKADLSSLFIQLTLRQIAQAGDRSLFYCVISDNTELRQAERGEKEAISRITAIMDNVDGGITAVCPKNGKPEMIFSNDKFYSQLGYTREQFNEEKSIYFEAIHPEDRGMVWKNVFDTLNSKSSHSMEYRCIKRDGSIINIRSNISMCKIDGIDEDVMVTVETDISELVEANRISEITNGQLKAVLRSMDNGITAVAIRGDKTEFILSNDKFFQLHGVDHIQEKLNSIDQCLQLVHPDDRNSLGKQIAESTKMNWREEAEYRVILPDSSTRWIWARLVVTQIDGIDAPVQVTVYSDITEDK